MSAAGALYVKSLAWDSRFFRFPVMQLECRSLTETIARAAIHQAEGQKARCVYYLCPTKDRASLSTAARYDFQNISSRLVFARDLRFQPMGPTVAVRVARPRDLRALTPFLKMASNYSRFNHDRHFPKGSAYRLYAEWLKQSIRGRFDDVVLVVLHQGRPAGLVSLRLGSNRIGQIGLIGVSPALHRLGLGRALIHTAMEWLQENKMKHVQVVTQGDNVIAQKFYRSCGFKLQATQTWHHRWVDQRRDPPNITSVNMIKNNTYRR